MYKRILLFLLAMCFLTVATGCSKEKEPVSVLEDADDLKENRKEEETMICVYVCGAVKKQGVYELPAKSRVYEAVEMAGGFQKNADITGINQAEILEDEALVYIPTKEEGEQAKIAEDGKVNLNTATKEELMTLSGVGEAKADSIIKHREEQGKFKKIEDIMEISGIKEGLFQKIKDDITV